MKPGNTPTPERSCRSKRRYCPEAEAHRVAAKCFEDRGEWLRVYACQECLGWHLTSMGAQPPADGRWRPPARPVREQAHEVKRREFRRRRGGVGKARRFSK